MVYIMEQWTQQPSIIDIEELRSLAVVATNHGFVRPAEQPVHFSVEYGNPIDLARVLPGLHHVLLEMSVLCRVSWPRLANQEVCLVHCQFHKLVFLMLPYHSLFWQKLIKVDH